MKYEVLWFYLSNRTPGRILGILLFVFSDDWLCVTPASDYNLESIAAITEGEEDMDIIASPSFKDYYISIGSKLRQWLTFKCQQTWSCWPIEVIIVIINHSEMVTI